MSLGVWTSWNSSTSEWQTPRSSFDRAVRRKLLARQRDARGYGFSKPAGLGNFTGERSREEAARAVVDTEARAEGGKRAPTLVSRCGLLAVHAEVDSGCESTPKGRRDSWWFTRSQGWVYLEEIDLNGAELLHYFYGPATLSRPIAGRP